MDLFTIIVVLVAGFGMGFGAGRRSAAEPTEEEMLRKLVVKQAAMRISTLTRERLEREITAAAEKVANAKTAFFTVCAGCGGPDYCIKSGYCRREGRASTKSEG